MEANLPQSDNTRASLDSEQILVVKVSADGKYFLGQTEMNLAELSVTLGKAIQSDPNIAVHLQVGKVVNFDTIASVLDLLNNKLGISKISLRS